MMVRNWLSASASEADLMPASWVMTRLVFSGELWVSGSPVKRAADVISGVGDLANHRCGVVGGQRRRQRRLINEDRKNRLLEREGSGPLQFDEVGSGGIGRPEKEEGVSCGNGLAKGFGPARAGAELFLISPNVQAEGKELLFRFGDHRIALCVA